MRYFQPFIRCRAGVALIEFAIVLPFLLLMLIGTIELARFAIINQKLDKTVNAMADFVTQGVSVSGGDLTTWASTANQIMTPFDFSGTIIFSSVVFFNSPTPPCTGNNVACISWQCKKLGSDASVIGGQGGNATLPGGYVVAPGQNVIVAEVSFNYTPMLVLTGTLIPSLAPQNIRKSAVYKPRQGTLTSLQGGGC